MQTRLLDLDHSPAEKAELESILSACVHCGFCNATCPTFQLLGDELDGPRGRIYLLKHMLESGQVSRMSQQHLDRCLSCLNCETTCPSGVKYGRLMDLSRPVLEQLVKRNPLALLIRKLILWVFPFPDRFKVILKVLRGFRVLLPESYKRRIPDRTVAVKWPQTQHTRKVIILEGCVQRHLKAEIDCHAVELLDKLGITVIRMSSVACCGALEQHMAETESAMNRARLTIDKVLPLIDEGVEAVIMSSSACGLMLESYAELLKHDPDYVEKSKQFADHVTDLSQFLLNQDLVGVLKPNGAEKKIAFHAACTHQHGLGLIGQVEKLLQQAGYELTYVQDAHLCCGSAGVYSLLQPEIAEQLRDNKIKQLQADQPEIIATTNIGCHMYLEQVAKVNLKHWIELINVRAD